MDVLSIIVLVVTGLVGLMMTVFTILNLFSNCGNPFGTFGTKFIFEMDKVMGGQLGIPHYSKIEACMLALAVAGCGASLFTDLQLLPVLGMTSGAAYMFICVFYGVFTGTPAGPFLVMGIVFSLLLAYRWVNHLDNAADITAGTIFALAMVGATLLAGIIMKWRDTPERQKFNQRFVRILKYCDSNADFVWLPGKDEPEGFTEDSGVEINAE